MSMARSPAIKKPPPPEFNCKSCTGEDTNDMVQCDVCEGWHHFTCVGVTAAIENVDWMCSTCSKGARPKSVLSFARSKIRPVSLTSSERRKRLDLQRLEEERALAEKREQEERIQREKDRALKELRDKEYMDKKYEILHDGSSCGDMKSMVDSHERTENWVRKNAGSEHNDPPLSNNERDSNIHATRISGSMRHDPPHGNTVKDDNLPTLSKSQVAARHVMSKDLPNFSGKPEEWPIFISCYETSTSTCGFTLTENMMRLQRCLKGRAMEAVRSKLLIPNMVPDVISTLKILYGRPELIINTMLQQIRSEPAPRADKLETLITFALSVQNLCATMQASGLVAHLCNPSLLQELTEKLPPQIRLNWAMYKITVPVVSLSTFGNWLFELAKAASEVTMTPSAHQFSENRTTRRQPNEREFLHAHSEEPSDSSRTYPGRKNQESATGASSRPRCPVCDRSCSKVQDCNKFTELPHTERWNVVKSKKLCRKCLGSHDQFRCKSRLACGKNGCVFKHHALLHNDSKPAVKSAEVQSEVCNSHQVKSPQVLFRVVPVTIYGKTSSINTFAFLDEGSSSTLIETEVADKLQLHGTPEKLCLKWTADVIRVEENSRRIALDISGAGESFKRYHLKDVRTVDKLNLPVQSMIAHEMVATYPHLHGIPLQDYVNATPQIIIGMLHCNLGLTLEYREGSVAEPVATKTRLGWVVHGASGQTEVNQAVCPSYHICECTNDKEIHSMVKDFFSTESFGVKVPQSDLESSDDKRSRGILEATTKKVATKFETGLLWKFDQVTLPDSLPMAKRRLICLEKKMSRDANYASKMKENIRDYVVKGYARKLSDEESSDHSPRTWYLPIFTVTNSNKPGKFRMVFDAAAMVKGISLNTVLSKGPDQLEPLPSVLYKFREGRIGITGDIKEMFHQVGIRKEDQNSQRFLWRNGDPTREPDVYVMQVMTFGATCSPSAAQFVKNKNALEWAGILPKAVTAITQKHYVDDWLDSVDSEDEAIQLANDVKHIHKQAGFEIRNFISNSPRVLQSINDSADQNVNKNMNICPEIDTEKVLGMWWNTSSDTFTYSLAFNKSNKDVLEGQRVPTKREVLRTLMSIFDPLGLLSFFLVFVKILLQDIWRTSVGWDDLINDDQNSKWLAWIKVLPLIEQVHIPRCYSNVLSANKQKSTQLHIFVDASSNAFAAVAYLRIEADYTVECAIVSAKNRVAPQKLLSIPRLELQAAVLGARLANSLCERHSVKMDRKYFWSDSKTVLYWLKSDPRKYRQFVAFRLGEILETTTIDDWRWIPSNQNVADEATKWSRVPDVSSSNRWFAGPEFLRQPEEFWPKNIWKSESGSGEEEIKPHFIHSTIQIVNTIDISRFSNWSRLVRTQAFVLRFVYNVKGENKSNRKRGPLSSEEISAAEGELYKTAQRESYPNEVRCLQMNSPVEKNSNILNRSPYLDSSNVLRVKGRIDSARGVSDDIKRPIIMPKDHQITYLLIDHYHRRYHHLFHETVVNEIQQKFSIPKLRVILRTVRKSCQRCKIQNAKPTPPEMADLPQARLASFTRPFSYIGIDYFGPMTVSVGRRTEKRWGVLITCMTVRAVHIEIAHSLTSESCIMAIRNFIARRGTPLEIYSDNGTNFHGADNELSRELKRMKPTDLQEEFTSSSMKWVFNPPAAPHMGGSWERLIRSVKKTLLQIKPSRNPSDEILRSLLMEVENIVNSRPLTYVALECDNDEALTPNHFLLGSSSGIKPPGCFSSEAKLLQKSWKISQQLASFFWKRWVHDYLPTLTRRTKWFSPVKPIEKGDVVIIIDENNPTNCWPKGIVVETIMGKNHQVRQAVVQTAKGVLTRPVVKLAVLDVRPLEKGM